MREKCHCGNLVEKTGTSKRTGAPIWGDKCRSCRGRYRYGILKADSCEQCNFIPQVSSQLEIDHIDGNRKNNDKSNLRTLCCNCHALKSHKNGDFRFTGESNPVFRQKHSEESLKKIREARKLQDVRRKSVPL